MQKKTLATFSARLGLVLVAAAAMVTAGFMPAHATSAPLLPPTQHLHALGCGENPPHLWTIDETNGSSTTFGTSTTSFIDCVYATSVNPVDGTVYVEYLQEINGSPVMYVGTLDFSSGLITQTAPVSGDTEGASYLIITNSGDAYGAVSGSWVSMNLGTGVISLIADGGDELAWVAYDAANDSIYGFRITGDTTADAFTIDRLTGALTADPSHNIVVPSGHVGCEPNPFMFYTPTGATFDRAGNLWFANEECASTLLVEDFATGTTYVQGDLTDANMTWGQAPRYTYSTMVLFLTPDSVPASPTLPETGVNSSVTAVSLAVSGSLLIAGALALVMLRRRRLS
jgi:LPXTG-motif cell wall-anchored protein